MVQSKDEILAQLKEVLGDNASNDNAIKLLEDITDTLDDTTDWKQKYEENDAMWNNKYTERFFSGTKVTTTEVEESGSSDSNEEDDNSPDNLTFESLFKEE
jgi:hypothetical protein